MRWLALVSIAACAPSTATLHRSVDRELARRLGGDLPIGDRTHLAELLAKPLDADAAVRIAFANSPRLEAALAEVGIVSPAWALGPLDVDLTYRHSDGDNELELTAVQDVLGLVASARRAGAHAELAAARARAVAVALRLAARV